MSPTRTGSAQIAVSAKRRVLEKMYDWDNSGGQRNRGE
jgi:hypothetical protein